MGNHIVLENTRIMMNAKKLIQFFFLFTPLWTSTLAFTSSPITRSTTPTLFGRPTTTTTTTNLNLNLNSIPTTIEAVSSFEQNSLILSAEPIDPAAALGQVLAGLVGSPAILIVPIFAGISVASVMAFFIASYANPTDPDAEDQ